MKINQSISIRLLEYDFNRLESLAKKNDVTKAEYLLQCFAEVESPLQKHKIADSACRITSVLNALKYKFESTEEIIQLEKEVKTLWQNLKL